MDREERIKEEYEIKIDENKLRIKINNKEIIFILFFDYHIINI